MVAFFAVLSFVLVALFVWSMTKQGKQTINDVQPTASNPYVPFYCVPKKIESAFTEQDKIWLNSFGVSVPEEEEMAAVVEPHFGRVQGSGGF